MAVSQRGVVQAFAQPGPALQHALFGFRTSVGLDGLDWEVYLLFCSGGLPFLVQSDGLHQESILLQSDGLHQER